MDEIDAKINSGIPDHIKSKWLAVIFKMFLSTKIKKTFLITRAFPRHKRSRHHIYNSHYQCDALPASKAFDLGSSDGCSTDYRKRVFNRHSNRKLCDPNGCLLPL